MNWQKKTRSTSLFCCIRSVSLFVHHAVHKQVCCHSAGSGARTIGGKRGRCQEKKPELLKPVLSLNKSSWTHSLCEQSLYSSLKWPFFQNSLFCMWRSSHWTRQAHYTTWTVFAKGLEAQFIEEMEGPTVPQTGSVTKYNKDSVMQPLPSTGNQLLVWPITAAVKNALNAKGCCPSYWPSQN